MTAHVFVDETKERGYVVAAAVVLPADLASARRTVSGLVMPRQRRIHFSSESHARRNKILDAILQLGATAMIYDASGYASPKQARDACLIGLVADLARIRAQRVVLELDDSAVEADRALLFAQVRIVGVADTLRYDHMRAHEECLLAIPDAIAWCWARGGAWRARVQQIVTDVRRV